MSIRLTNHLTGSNYMIKSKTLISIGSSLTILTGLIAFSSTYNNGSKKPAIEVVTHAGAGGGTDVNQE